MFNSFLQKIFPQAIFDPRIYEERFYQDFLAGKSPSIPSGFNLKMHSGIGPFRVLGIHHLSGEENRGKYHCYVSALNEDGLRMPDALFHFGYGDYLHVGNENKQGEAQDAFPMWGNVGNNYFVSAGLDGTPRGDTVTGLGTQHPDSIDKGNTIGHHSFFIVFGVGEKKTPPIDPPPLPPNEEPPKVINIEGELDGIIFGGKFKGVINNVKWLQ